MSGSPFHGIFSALNQNGSGKNLFSFGARRDVTQTTEAGLPAGASAEAQAGKLAVDIYDQDDYTIIRAPIAGVRLSDIDIEVNENVLTIRGTRRQPETVPTDQYYLRECFWGPFARNITLPGTIDPKKVRATFSKDCILKVLIPKENKVKTVQISEA
ncbi:MAG: Hsp20/alpha crystallin family protein [Candidatus Peribacteraceae bacterium]|nr:Hsp20/alpha crystallin family protein [Candidatus Peribacteraceae bacterium]